MAFESIPAYTRFGGGSIGKAYNEPAFRYFLTIERKRANRTFRSVPVVLVNIRKRPGVDPSLTGDTAAAVFSALGACVREGDFVGWYREGLVAAAALTLRQEASGTVRRHMIDRVVRTLNERIPGDQAARLRVRVVDFGDRDRM